MFMWIKKLGSVRLSWGSWGFWGLGFHKFLGFHRFLGFNEFMRFLGFLVGPKAQKLLEVLIKLCCLLRFKGYQSDFLGQFANLISE